METETEVEPVVETTNPFNVYLRAVSVCAAVPVPKGRPAHVSERTAKMKLFQDAMQGKGWMRSADIAPIVGFIPAQVNTYLQETLYRHKLVQKRKVQGVRTRLIPNEWLWVGALEEKNDGQK